jgi:hypothetical protein
VLTRLTRLELDFVPCGVRCTYAAFVSAISSIRGLRDLDIASIDVLPPTSQEATTAPFRSLTRLQLCRGNFAGGVELDRLAGLTSLQTLSIAASDFNGSISSLSRLTQLEALAFRVNKGRLGVYELPTSSIAALTNLTSLDIGRPSLSSPQAPVHLDQAQLQQLQPVLGGLNRLKMGCFRGVQDAALLEGIGCTDLRCGGFEGCAEPPPGSGRLLPSVASLQLWGPLCPMVLRQAGLTSLSLLGDCSDDDCRALACAFPQLRALQLACPGEGRPGISAAGLAHLSALQQLQQLGLVVPDRIGAAELRALASLPGVRRLVISLAKRGHGQLRLGFGAQPVVLEEVLANLAGACRALREVVLALPCWVRMSRWEALCQACDRVVGRYGRQELAVEVKRMGDDDAWEWMLAGPAG